MTKSFLFATSLAMALSAFAVSHAFAAALPQVTPETFEQRIGKADKPTVALVIPKDCNLCAGVEEALAASAGKFDNMQVVKIDEGDVGRDKGNVPGVLVFIPDRDFVAEGIILDKDASSVAAFLQSQSQYFAKRAPAAAALKQAKEALSAAAAPYNAQQAALVKQALEDFKPEMRELAALQDQMFAAKDEASRLAATKAYMKAAEALAQKMQPVEDKIQAIKKQAATANASLSAAYKAALAEVNKLDQEERQMLKQQGEDRVGKP